jgi:hypothetical protein
MTTDRPMNEPHGEDPTTPRGAHEPALAETRAWGERAVIGLDRGPFAKAPQVNGQVRYVLSEARDAEALLEALQAELETLAEADPLLLETTLLVHPHVLTDFAAFNDFLDPAEDLLEAMDLVGIVQIASFHPDFQFEGTQADDIGNATNRSPYPTLHLLREASIERAVEAFPDPAAIFEANLATLEALGADGWNALRAQCRADAAAASDSSRP